MELKTPALDPLAPKVVLGCGKDRYDGWIMTDRREVDVTSRAEFAARWSADSVSTFLAEHVWEHLNSAESLLATQNVYEFLMPGGRFRVAVPDGFNPNKAYQDHVKPFGDTRYNRDHKQLWNYQSLSSMLSSVGFECELLEYYDEFGTFHKSHWRYQDGPIKRTHRSSFRIARLSLSLIIDGFKRICEPGSLVPAPCAETR